MSAPSAGAGGGGWSLPTGATSLPKKRTKIVFLNPTELSNWDDWKSNNEQSHIGETDLLQYEQMLQNQPPTSSSNDDVSTNKGSSDASSKKKRKQKNTQIGSKKRAVDSSQPWLQDSDSNEEDAGLEDELDDDEYFRLLEEEKLREDEEEARRKKELSEARALARLRGSSSLRKAQTPSTTRTGRPVPPEASDSESFSEFGEGTFSSVGGSRADADEFDNPRSLYTHDEEEEETVLEDEAIDGKNNRSVLDDLPPPPSPADKSLETCNLGTSQAKFARDIALSSLAPADSHTLRMIAMDPVRLRFCSPPLHLPGSSNDLVCPSEYLIDAFAIHEVLIRYGYLLRLSPFKIEDFLAALISNENSLLLAEVHITLLRALLREDEATGTWMYSIDCKDSVNLSYYLLDRYNWPYLLAAYINCVKSTEDAAVQAASSLSVLGAATAGPGGIAAATDSILTATLFPEDLIPLDENYPFVPIRQRVAVLRGLVNLFLGSRPVRGDQLRDGYLTHEDHCRVCQQSGEVLCCDGCTAVFHLGCLNPPLTSVPPANWVCPVCIKKQVPGVHECLTEEERTRKLHRREPLGSDRAGRTYWYIARRVLVEPTDFTQREPCLPGILDGVYDPHWQQAYADRFLDEHDSDEDSDEATSLCSANGDGEELPERPLRRVRCNPMVEYATEPPVYYYSTVEQVIELRARLSMRWEPWLCQRLDALMPRIQVEMLVTQQLTTEGLDVFCCLRSDHERVALSQALDYVEPGAALSHVTRVFALLEAEARQSQLRMDLDRDRVEDALEYRSIDSLLNAPPTLGLKVVKSRAPDALPDDSLSELCDGEESSILGVLIACDANTCFVRNHDGLFVRVNRPNPVMHDVCSTLFTSEERSIFALPDPELTSDTSPESSHLSSPRLRAYRLSDEGTWRSWSNLYTVGVWLGSDQQQVTDDTRPDGAPKSDGAERKTLAHRSVRKEGDEELGKSSAALVNVMFSRAQVAEDRERKRIMGNKFSFTDTTTELWNYVEPPLLASFFTDLVELLKCPCALDDNLFRPDWPATPWQSADVLRLTIAYMEAQLPLAFFSPAWCSLRKHWLSRLIEAKTLAELVNSLATLEASIRPLCYQRIWYGSVGHLIFERSTAAQREEDRRVRQLDRSASSSTAGANNLSQNLIRTKTPRPIRHTVWKSRGEEYRRLGGDGWMWLSSTRRSTSEESKMLLRTYPAISELYHRSDSSRPRTRGLQHGIGWGVCPEYLKGEVAVKPPKASECRGHVLHPITGIPLYLNTRRTPYIIPEETLRQLVKTIVSSPSTSESSCKVDDDVKSVRDELVDNRILTGDVSVLETDALSPKLDAPECPSSPNPNSSALDSSKASDDSQTKQSLPEPDNEPLVMNVSYGLTERIHFPPAVVRPTVHSSSRRLRFRLDDLLSRRVAAAAADKAAAESAKMNIKTLDHDVRELEQEKSRLEVRLSELADEAQEARSAKAKAVKARQAAGPSPLPVSVLQPQVRSAPFVVSTAGNRSVNLAALQQDTPSVSRRLIQHSFISTSSGNRYRILPQSICQPAVNVRPVADSRSSSRRRFAKSHQRSSDDNDESDADGRKRGIDDSDYNPSEEYGFGPGQQLRRSSRKQRATRHDPDFIVDFDDLEDEEDDVNDALSKNRGHRLNRRCEEDDNDDDHGSDDELDDENSNVGPRPRTRFPLSARPRITRLPQFDGAGDSALSSAEEGTENLEFGKEPSDSSNGPTPKNPCLDDVQTLESPQVPKEDAATPRHGGVINRIVRLVRTVDEQNTPTTASNALTEPPVTDTDSSASTTMITTDGAKITMEGLRFIVNSTGALLPQSQPSSAVTASNSTDSALPNASSTLSSTAGSVVVNLPAGFRLLSANPTPTAAVATTASVNSVVPVRLVGTNLAGNVSSGSTAISNTTVTPMTANAIPITMTGPNTVRLVLHSSRINSTSSDCLQTITLTPVPSQDTNSAVSCTNSSTTTTILSESGAAVSDATSRCQPAILRRTLVGVPTGELKTGEIRVITLPHQSVASLVATNTARQISAGVPTCRDGSNELGESQSRHTSIKAASRSAPLIEDRAAPSAQRSFAPRILPRGVGVAPGLLNVGMMVQSNETVVALERAVTEATTRLNKVGAEAVEIKKQLLEVGQKLKQMSARLSQLRDLQECASRPTSAAYSLLHKRRIDPEMDDSSNEKPGGDETYAKEEISTEEKQVVLPAELPPVNTYVWPPLEWSSEQKRGFPSVSSLFRLHPKNLRGLILAAGRRELPGFDAEKKRLVQVVWPYPTAKPSLMEAWRLRLSQLRLKPTDSSRMVHFPGQGLAHLFLLLRSLWHMIRWDDVLGEPADGEHILDDEGHPCLREVTDYADSGTGKSGEPAYCTRRIIGVQPLDRFWLRANYLVQLTHTNPVHERSSRSKNSRGSVTRSGRHSMAGGRHPWTGTELRKRHSSRRPGKQRSRRSGNDPDYNPSEDEPWRFTSRRSRRRARGTDDDSDDDDANRNPNDGDDSDETSDTSDAAGHTANRISRIEEVWMSEDSLRMWEIRTFMNAYLPPQSSDYLGGLLNDDRGDKVPGDALMKARRRPARLPHPKAEACQTTEQQRKAQLTKSEIIMNNEHVLDLPFSVLFNRDAQSMNRRGAFEPVNLASGRSVTRRSRPPPEIPVVSSEVLEAKARARSLAATRAARASVLARKAKAERAAMEQHARTLRTQLITRRRLYLNLARALADAAVEKQKQNLFAQCQSDSADEDDSDSIQTSPVQSRLAPSRVATLKQTPGPIIRRPRGRPPTSGRYRVNRGLRRPLTSSQVSYQSTPSNVASGLGVVDKTPLATIKNVLDNEEQENKPEWTFSRGGATAYRPRSVRRGSIPNRRGRPRGRTLSRASAPIPETLMNRTPVPLSPSHDDSNDLSSAPSTPSTCPALGDSRLEALLTMPEGGADSMQWSPRRSAKPEQPIYFSRGACDSVRSARGARRRVGRPPGRGLRGASRRLSTNAGEMSSDLTPDNRISSACSPPPAKMERPPTNEQQRSNSLALSRAKISGGLYCLCRTPYNPAREYLGCDLCHDWFHFECVGLNPTDASKLGDSWHCPDCQRAEEHANEMLYCLCRTPYEPTRVYIACDRCDEWYHAECVGLTSQQAATHAGTYLCPRCTEVQPPDSFAPKKSEEVHLKEEDPDSNTKTLYEMALTAALQSQLAVLLRELQEHKMAWPFLQLPDPEKYPAIESLEDPKTLARIAERLTVGQYTTLGDFSFAMNSLFFDARILYLKGTPEFHCTEVMEALFIRKMKELKTRFTPAC